MEIETFKNSPEDIKLFRSILFDKITPWRKSIYNNYIKSLSIEDLYSLFHMTDEKAFFLILLDALGEPLKLKEARTKKYNEYIRDQLSKAPKLEDGQGALFPEAFDEEPEIEPYIELSAWEEWQEIKHKKKTIPIF